MNSRRRLRAEKQAEDKSLKKAFRLIWPRLPVQVCMGTQGTGWFVHAESSLGETPHEREMRDGLEELFLAAGGQATFGIEVHYGHDDPSECEHVEPTDEEWARDAIRDHLLAQSPLKELWHFSLAVFSNDEPESVMAKFEDVQDKFDGMSVERRSDGSETGSA